MRETTRWFSVRVGYVLLAVAGLVAGGTGWPGRSLAQPAAEPPSANPAGVGGPGRGPAQPAAEPPAVPAAGVRGIGGPFVVRGRVLGPDGKPMAGADLSLVARWPAGNDLPPGARPRAIYATTGSDGSYSFTAFGKHLEQGFRVVATARDCGPDWLPLSAVAFDPAAVAPGPLPRASGTLPDLKLVKDDVPITGRVLDLESQPVAGAAVRVLRVLKAPGEDLQPFFKVWAGDAGRYLRRPIGYEEGVMTALEMVQDVKTGDDGRFSLSGFGRGRRGGAGDRGTRAGKTGDGGGHAGRFTRPAEGRAGHRLCGEGGSPARPGQAGCRHGPGEGHWQASGRRRGLVRNVSGDDGRRGAVSACRCGKSQGVHPHHPGRSLHPVGCDVGDTPGVEAITADLDVERGLEVRGRLIDKATGRPVRGLVSYHARVENPHLKDYPSFTKLQIVDVEMYTDREGAFSLAVPPGQGVIYAYAWDNRFTNAHSWPAVSVDVVPTPWRRVLPRGGGDRRVGEGPEVPHLRNHARPGPDARRDGGRAGRQAASGHGGLGRHRRVR